MKMKNFKDYLVENEEVTEYSDRDAYDASQQGSSKITLPKAPWDKDCDCESDDCDCDEVKEAGGYYTQPVYDMIEKHGYEKVMHELLTSLDADVIQDALSRMSQGLGEEATETCEDCGCTIGQPETGCECGNDAHTHAHEELDYLRKLAGM